MQPPMLSHALALVGLVLTLSACGAAPTVTSGAEPASQADAVRPAIERVRSVGPGAPAGAGALPAQAPANAAANPGQSGGAPIAAAAPTAAPAAAPPANAGRVAGAVGQLPAIDQKIIRTGKIELVVASIASAIDSITTQVATVGGFVQQSATKELGADLVVRVPVDQYDAAFRDLRKLAAQGTRIIESSEAQDVTEQYADSEARIGNLKVTEAQLLKLLARAEKMEDIVVVQREITGIREQIERLQGQINVLGRRAAFSTIAISLRPQEETRKPAPPALVLPPGGAGNINIRPVFTWAASPAATGYELQVATEIDTTFSNPIGATERVAATSYEWAVADPDLQHGTNYRWRVRAVNAAGEGDWSQVRQFTTSPAWAPLRTASDSWLASLTFLQRFIDTGLRITVFFWWLILLLVGGLFALRRYGRPFGRRSTNGTPPTSPTP